MLPSNLRQVSHSTLSHCRLTREALGKLRPRGVSCVYAQLRLDRLHSDKGFDKLPDQPGVYGVYDAEDKLQYLGITRKAIFISGSLSPSMQIRTSVMGHARDLPQLTREIGYLLQPDATREELQATWKQLAEQHVKETGEIPPGNQPDNPLWKSKRAPRPKPEIQLTPGKGIDDLTVPIEKLIDGVVKSYKVVAFIKGTRTEPQCGFSYQMLSILNQNGVDYDVVNVLDEVYNPEVREKIKTYSEWPTIPQLYVNGEFVGGTDIITEMQNRGDLQELLKQ